MKFSNIHALVPEGEHFDETAMNGGIWLTEGHVGNVENTLVTAAASLTQSAARIQELTEQLTTSQSALAEAQNQLTAANSTISTLQGEVADLRQAPAGTISQTTKSGGDKPVEGEKKVSAVTKEANALRALQGKPPIK